MTKGTQVKTTQVIFVVGNPGAGKSTFIKRVTSKPSFVGSIIHSLTPGKGKIQAASHQESEYTILVDTPGFDDTTIPDRDFISKVTTWFNKKYKGKDVQIGIIFLHQISDRRFSDERNPLHTVRALAQSPSVKDRISKIVFATSMWSNMISEKSQSEAKIRERGLTEKWTELTEELGVEAEGPMEFYDTSPSVEQILQNVILTC